MLKDPGPMNRSASVIEFDGERRHASNDADGWSGSSGESQPVMEKSLVATMMTLVSLMEETARIQKEIAELLRELARGGNDAAIQRLNRAWHPISRPSSVQNSLSSPLGRAGMRHQRPKGQGQTPPAEPLTAREEAVLRFLMGKLSLREIGQEMYVSHNTIKSHTRAIYRKLGVSNRHEAIQHGRERFVGQLP